MEGECLAVVGESGSGKTTLVRCLIGIHSPESGRILLDGSQLESRARRRSATQRRRIQVVFQNPDESLNPRHTVVRIVARPVEQFEGLSRREAQLRAFEALDLVRLDSALAERYPRDLSGGEKQRVAIARALVARPDLLICDEITSALDVSVQAAVLELIKELRKSMEMSIVFVSHDLAVVRSIADRIVVLEHGEVRELGATELIFDEPTSDYTRSLIRAQQSWSIETSSAALVARTSRL
jgi:peptide/nickel transport system ATP-binding protein